jgi:DnaJ family protein C protein 28
MINIEDHIRRAMEEGQFDDLPGKGKPLRLDENPYEDPEWSQTYRVLRNGRFTLPWIETRQAIDAEIGETRLALKRAWEWYGSTSETTLPVALVESEWARAVETFRQRIDAVNNRIKEYNLETPSERFQMRILRFERELELTTTPPSDKLPEIDTSV